MLQNGIKNILIQYICVDKFLESSKDYEHAKIVNAKIWLLV